MRYAISVCLPEGRLIKAIRSFQNWLETRSVGEAEEEDGGGDSEAVTGAVVSSDGGRRRKGQRVQGEDSGEAPWAPGTRSGGEGAAAGLQVAAAGGPQGSGA